MKAFLPTSSVVIVVCRNLGLSRKFSWRSLNINNSHINRIRTKLTFWHVYWLGIKNKYVKFTEILSNKTPPNKFDPYSIIARLHQK